MIRRGILGASGFAPKPMAPAISRAQGAQPAALAPRLCTPHIHDALLAAPRIDAVYVARPNSLHTPWVIRVPDAGQPAACAKPLTLRVADFATVRAAHSAPKAFVMAHHPQWRMLRDLITERRIATRRHMLGVFTYFNDDPANIRNQAALGGGALYTIGIDPIGALRLGPDLRAPCRPAPQRRCRYRRPSERHARRGQLDRPSPQDALPRPGQAVASERPAQPGPLAQSAPGSDLWPPHPKPAPSAGGSRCRNPWCSDRRRPAQWPLEMSRETQQIIDSTSLLTHEDPSHG